MQSVVVTYTDALEIRWLFHSYFFHGEVHCLCSKLCICTSLCYIYICMCGIFSPIKLPSKDLMVCVDRTFYFPEFSIV